MFRYIKINFPTYLLKALLLHLQKQNISLHECLTIAFHNFKIGLNFAILVDL